MAEALLRGALAAKVLSAEQVTAADPVPERRELFASLGARAVAENREAAEAADVLVLAVKPQQLTAVLAELAVPALGKLIISIVAGAPVKRLSGALSGARVIRTMPNTPLLVGMGATVMAAGPGATAADMALARQLFEASGAVLQMHDKEIDAVTAVSGSGPAYLFYLAEAMLEAARAEGLTAGASRELVGATLRGAAEMLVRGSEAPEELRRRVTSPGGTTQAAVEVLDAAEVRAKLVQAVRRAAERSRELGRG
jgi:pyrroline-5-carboxylate reductase